MRPCEVCGKPGQRHHIVFRSHGGLNIEVNYCYLCAWHHIDGPDAPHRNRETDLRLKIRMQRDLENLFWRNTYTLEEIADRIGLSKKTLAKKMRTVKHRMEDYGRKDIITFLMGGRLYETLQPGHETSGSVSDAGFILLAGARGTENDGGGDSQEGEEHFPS